VEPCCTGLDPAEPLHGIALVTMGLTVSLGHCLGMCGPIVLGFSAAQRARGAKGVGLAIPLALYHGGRITSYVLLGAALGLLGSAAGLAATQGALSIAVGALMALLALGLLGLLPTRAWVEGSPLAGVVSGRIRALLRTGRPAGQYGLGLANGFLPCGPVAVVALGAATAGGALRGGLSLLLYGLGTLPALAVVGFGAGSLGPGLRRRLDRLASGLVLALAVQLVLRGLAAYGVVPHLEIGPVVLW
jgi:hypothetical protein